MSAPAPIINTPRFFSVSEDARDEENQATFRIYVGITRLVILPNNRLRLIDNISGNIIVTTFNLKQIEKTQELTRSILKDYHLCIQRSFIKLESRYDYLDPGYCRGSLTFTTKTKDELRMLELQIKVLKLFDEKMYSFAIPHSEVPIITYVSGKLPTELCEEMLDEVKTQIANIFTGKKLVAMEKAELIETAKIFKISEDYVDGIGIEAVSQKLLPELLEGKEVK